jgi:hypothetical protein
MSGRVLRDIANQVLQAPFVADLRIARVSARDTSLRLLTVELGGDTGNPVSGVRIANTSYYPRVDDLAVVVQNRSDLYALGAVNAQVGHMRIRKGGTSAIANNVSSILTMGTAVPEVDTDGLWGVGGANDRVTFPWPGIWSVDYQAWWATALVGRRIVEIVDNTGSVRASQRNEVESDGDHREVTCNPHIECYFDAGQYVRAQAFQTSGASLTIADFDFSNIWTATWRGPV